MRHWRTELSGQPCGTVAQHSKGLPPIWASTPRQRCRSFVHLNLPRLVREHVNPTTHFAHLSFVAQTSSINSSRELTASCRTSKTFRHACQDLPLKLCGQLCHVEHFLLEYVLHVDIVHNDPTSVKEMARDRFTLADTSHILRRLAW